MHDRDSGFTENAHGLDDADSQRMREVLDALLDPFLIASPVRAQSGEIVDFRFDDANLVAFTYFGLPRESLIGSTFTAMFPGVGEAGLLDACLSLHATGDPLQLDDFTYVNDLLGGQRSYDLRGVRLGDELVFTFRDVTAQRENAIRLANSEELYRLLAENAWDVIWTMELDGSISYISPSVERVRGFTPEEAAAQTLDQIHTPDSIAQVVEYFDRLYAAISVGAVPPRYHGEREYFRKDGSIMLGELEVIPQVDAEGRVVKILGVTRDVTERRLFEDELSRMAVTDPLTGLWNRRQGISLFLADISEARRYDMDVSVLMLDVDHFKEVNDVHGHAVGDSVLIELARRLTSSLRASDVLARWGGEEFVIVMRRCTISDAVPLAEKLRAIIADTDFPGVGHVTVSIGAAELKADESLDTWIGRADMAMYDAKESGRDAVRAAA